MDRSGVGVAGTLRFLEQVRRRRRLHMAGLDIYMAVFAIIVLGAAVGSLGRRLTWATSRCPFTGACVPLQELGSGVVAGAFSLVTTAVCLVLGPHVASSAERFWLYTSPLDRGGLLRAHHPRQLAVIAVCGLSVGLLVEAVLHGGWLSVLWTISASSLGYASAEAVQARSRWRGPALVAQLLGFLLACAAVVLVASTTLSIPPASLMILSLAAAAAGPAAAGVVIALNRASLGTVPIWSLAASGGLRDGVQGAAASLDGGLVFDIVSARLRRAVRPGGRLRVYGSGIAAWISIEVSRVLRRSPILFVGYPAALLVALVSQFAGAPVCTALTALTFMAASTLLLTSVRAYRVSAGLRRLFPQSGVSVRLACSAMPVMAAMACTLVWWPVAHRSLGPLGLFGLSMGGLAAALRWVSTGSADFSVGIVVTEMGPMPLGAFLTAVRGLDMLMLVVLPVLMGLPPSDCLPVDAACLLYSVWRG